MALTTAIITRQRGGLSAASTAGVVRDDQLDAAIKLATVRLVSFVGQTIYDEVAAWTSEQLAADPAKEDKKNAFVDAESYLALSFVPDILKNAQHSASGLEQRTIVGESVTEFAPVEEGQKIRRVWESAALRVLTPYLDIVKKDSNGDDLSIKRGGLMIMVI